jgi:hypothetical protein
MTNWQRWCKDAVDLSVRGDTIDVALPDGRQHCISVEESGDGIRLMAKVASRGALIRLEEPELWVWKRNRVVSIVGFRIDRYESLIGEVSVPSEGLDGTEFGYCVRSLAAECDRLELLLTGEDVE